MYKPDKKVFKNIQPSRETSEMLPNKKPSPLEVIATRKMHNTSMAKFM